MAGRALRAITGITLAVRAGKMTTTALIERKPSSETSVTYSAGRRFKAGGGGSFNVDGTGRTQGV
jgi:hypothetical protein